jgi:hypothetical protein
MAHDTTGTKSRGFNKFLQLGQKDEDGCSSDNFRGKR